MNVIERLAHEMRARTERSWPAALRAANRDRLVDLVELQQARAKFGEAGAQWIYDASLYPEVESEDLMMDDTTEIKESGPFDELGTEPGVLNLDELIMILTRIRNSDPHMASRPPMVSMPGILRGISYVRAQAVREDPVSEEDYAVVMVVVR